MPLFYKLAFRSRKTVFCKEGPMCLSILNLPSEISASQLSVSRKLSPSRQSDAASIET